MEENKEARTPQDGAGVSPFGENGNLQDGVPVQNIDVDAEKVSEDGEPKRPEQNGFDEARFREIARDEATRAAQHFTDKLSERMNKTIRERFEGLERNKQVLGLSDEQVEAAKRKIVEEERDSAVMGQVTNDLNPSDGSDQKPVGTVQGGQPNGNVHPVIATALQMMSDEQVMIEESDPEFGKYLKPLLGGQEIGNGFLTATVRAVDAKKARLAAQKENANARTAGSADGRVVAPNDISGINDSKSLYLMGEKQLRKK